MLPTTKSVTTQCAARPSVTFLVSERYILYYSVTEARVFERLVQTRIFDNELWASKCI